MQIQVDTREHKSEWLRIQKQFDKLGVSYFRSKLYVGDYCSVDNPRIVIDRKRDLSELCGNVCQQHERFKAELIRAMKAGFRLVILVEHGEDVQTLEDVYFWDNPRREIYTIRMTGGVAFREPKYPNATTGKQLYKSLLTIRDRYNVDFAFCTKDETGRRIVELLEAVDG